MSYAWYIAFESIVLLSKGDYNEACTAAEEEREINVELFGSNSLEVQVNDLVLNRFGRGQKEEDTVAALVSALKKFKDDREKLKSMPQMVKK